MPLYEYRCRTCGSRFEMRRAMSEAGIPTPCPDGHDDTVRLLSTFATASATASASPERQPAAVGGGCCGGGCGCRH